MLRYLITVEGRVQGVGMRYFARRKAEQLGITGWVENKEDGSVLLAAQGEEKAVYAFLAAIQKGNWAIRVDHLSVRDLPITEEEREFSIISG